DVRDHLGGRERPELSAHRQVQTSTQAEEQPRGVEVPCPGGVDERIRRIGVDHVDLGTVRNDRAVLTTCQRRHLALAANSLERGVEIVYSVERADLRFVGDQDVDVV